MKNVLIVHAHPEAKSFCSSLKNTAKEHFTNLGYTVTENDLYAMNFNPVGDANDFKQLANNDYFKYQTEQLNASQNNLFAPEIQVEIDKLLQCDILILNFPLWWFGLPAILKGWIDRVFAMGVVYGGGKGVYENGIFKNKKAFLTLTTGGPEIAYNGGKNGNLDTILFPINHGMLYFTGMQVLPPYISYSPARLNKEELESELDNYKNYLDGIETLTSIY